MALDGIFLSNLKTEIENRALFSRVDKITQPSKDEILLYLRAKSSTLKLLLCVRANSPRIHFTSRNIENPAVPPMLCMLLRKRLTGALLKSVRQFELDRALFLDFDATNEIGDRTGLTLCIEIMGKYSNIILFDENKVIVDSVKRVDFSTSSVRQILPGLNYVLPPKQSKCCLLTQPVDEAVTLLKDSEETRFSKAVMSAVQGVSPVICREIAFLSCGGDLHTDEVKSENIIKAQSILENIKSNIGSSQKAYMILDEEGKPIDFSFMPVSQYGNKAFIKEYDSFSGLLDDFYYEKDRIERTKQKGRELFKLVANLTERTARKLNIRQVELEKCADREKLRISAELINANLYRLEKGSFYYDIENFYDNNNILRIKCDPALSPVQNAQKYYKEYKKAQTAEKMLTELIENGKSELEYFKTVEDELIRADTQSDLSQIRQELRQSGYIKSSPKNERKQPKALPPMEFMTSDGFKVYVGRNNVQNDRLSMKQANNHDMFLHIQKQPGSHVIIVSDRREISDTAIEQAAVIAAYYSSGRESSLVPVDYTLVKNLKKPTGAKPGYVIYHVYYTITVKPDENTVESLRIK